MRIDRAPDGERGSGPGEHDDGHNRRGDHDLERLAARLVNAEQILAQEVERDAAGDRDGAPVLDGVARRVVDMPAAERGASVSSTRPTMYCPAETPLIGPVEHVVEEQRRDRELGEETAHRFLDDAIDAAAHEQCAAFDVDAPHAVAEQQHAPG